MLTEMKKAKEIAIRKLKDWKEEDHKASKIAVSLVKRDE